MSRDSECQFLDYDLPDELIAQSPAEPRDSSRLLCVDRQTQSLADRHFYELPGLLRAGDLIVLNDTKVLPARLNARRATGGRVEVLLLERRDDTVWEALVNPLGRLRPGESLIVDAVRGGTTIEFLEREGNVGLVRVPDETVITRYGSVPLPPYIHSDLSEPERYQTVYAEHAGSAAAPTAGLHFTETLFSACRESGIESTKLTLHVGVDTFRPLQSENVEAHDMHSEWYRVPRRTIDAIERTRASGGRVVAVGTTVSRVLETLGQYPTLLDAPLTGRTDLFIRPPYEFRVVDALITNFHLPRTTLLLLVGAFAGTALLELAYRHAIDERYRFYSFGDAMLIV